jgi:hypothetical protein
LATGENVTSLLLAVVAVLAPWLAVLLMGLLVYWLGKRALKLGFRSRNAAPKSQGSRRRLFYTGEGFNWMVLPCRLAGPGSPPVGIPNFASWMIAIPMPPTCLFSSVAGLGWCFFSNCTARIGRGWCPCWAGGLWG